MTAPVAPGRSGRIWTLVLVCVSVFCLLMNVTIVAVALPSIQKAMDTDLSNLSWVINAYNLPLACLMLTAATLGDRLGRKKIFQAGMLVFTIGSLACALTSSPLPLEIARVVQGLGGTMLFAMTLPLIGAAFPDPKARTGAIGAFGASIAAAIAVGPLLGGALCDGPGWRWIFLVTVPVTAAAFLIGFKYLDESRSDRPKPADWPGTVLLTLGLVASLYGLVQGNKDGWTSAKILTSFTVGGALLIGFVVWEALSKSPMLELRLFKNRKFLGVVLASFGVEATLVAIINYLAIWVQNGLEYDAIDAGVRFLPLTGAAFIAAPLAAKLSRKISDQWLCAYAMVLVAAGIWSLTGLNGNSSWTHLIVGFILAGAGMGMISSSASAAALNAVEPRDAGMATGAVNTLRRMGTSIGVAVMGAVFEQRVASDATTRLHGPKIPEAMQSAAKPITEALQSGAGVHVAQASPPQGRAVLTEVAQWSTAYGTNQMLVVSAIGATVLAALTILMTVGKGRTAPAQDVVADKQTAPAAAPPVGAPVSR
ncbi:MFS transporter [Streptomyces sp. NBC_01007]|nr:MFS transporter [Streptomyces sp. NBC_01007]WRZ95702.1 MFS transporter [Streptomyces sp. NBC_01007]